MKSPWFILVLSSLLAAHAFAEAPKVKVHVRFYELSGKAALTRNLSLRSIPGVDVLTMPPFTMESGKSAEASVERDFRGARTPKNMPKVGVSLTIRPTVKGERIVVSVDSKRVEYIGLQTGDRRIFRRAEDGGSRAGGHRVFEIGKRTNMRGSGRYGEPVRFELGTRVDQQSATDEDSGRAEVVRTRRRLVATLIFTRA